MRGTDWTALAALILLAVLFFFFPMEHKYDKVFRFYSLTLIPSGLELPRFFDKKIYFYISDLVSYLLFGLGLYKMRSRMFDRRSLPLAFVFLCSAASIAASPLANYSLLYIRLIQFFAPFSLYLFLSTGWIDKKKLFSCFSWSLFVCAVIQSCIASVQYLTQKTVGLRFWANKCSRLLSDFPGCGG